MSAAEAANIEEPEKKVTSKRLKRTRQIEEEKEEELKTEANDDKSMANEEVKSAAASTTQWVTPD